MPTSYRAAEPQPPVHDPNPSYPPPPPTWPADRMTATDHLNHAASILADVERRYADDAEERRQNLYDIAIANAHTAIAQARFTRR